MKKLLGLTLLTFIPFLNSSAQTTHRGVGVRIRNERGQVESVKLYEGSYALIIGAVNYRYWAKLGGVRDDLPAVRSVLEKHGFKVEELLDPTGDDLLARINKFINDYGLYPDNRLLIYFSGHGYTEVSGDGRKFGYVVPVDAPKPSKDLIGFQQKALTMDELETAARRIRSKHALFVFDSCFSGTLVSRGDIQVPRIIDYYAASPVRQFITSGADNQEVPEESVFRRVFVQGLKGKADANGDGYVTGTELATYLQDQVTYYRGEAQTPQYGKIRDPRLDSGDFIFILPGPTSVERAREPHANSSQDATFYFNRGRDHYFLGNYDEAIADYNDAIALNPQYAEAFLYRGHAYSRKQDYERALLDYNRAVQLDPKYSDTYSHRGNVYSLRKNYAQAIADYTRAIQLQDDGYTYIDYINRGDAYFHLGDLDHALADFTETIRRAPDYARAYRFRASTYLKKREEEKAKADLLKADELEKRGVKP